MWLFWGSLLGFLFLVMLTIRCWDFLYSLLLKVHAITIRAILRQSLKLKAHSGLSKVYDIIITQASFMWLFWGSLSWFHVTCSVFCNAFYLMLTAILCACNPFWQFTLGSSLLASSISKQYLETVLIVLTRTLDERHCNMQIREQAMGITKASLKIITKEIRVIIIQAAIERV